MSQKALIGGLLQGFSTVLGQQLQQKHEDAQRDRSDQLRMRELVMNSADATPEDKQRALDEYMDIVQGKKPGAAKTKASAGADDPTSHARDVIGRALNMPPPGPSGITQPGTSGVNFNTDLPPMPTRAAQGQKKPAASFATSLPEIPKPASTSTRSASGYQMNRREQDAATARQQELDDNARDFQQRKELEDLKYKHDLAVKAGNLTRTGTKMPGSAVPYDTDNFGDPIDRSEGVQYDVFKRGDGTTTVMRTTDRAMTAPERVTKEKADQLKAMDQAAGRPLKSDTDYMVAARVDIRSNELKNRTEKQGRYQQFLKTANAAVSLTNARTDLDVERLKQIQQEFPYTFALKQLNVDTAKAKLDLLGQTNPAATMEWADNQARILVTQKGSPYLGEDITKTRDSLLSEMGLDPVELQAQIKTRNEPKKSAVINLPNTETSNPKYRAKVQEVLTGANKDSSDASIDKFLNNPQNLALIKKLVGG